MAMNHTRPSLHFSLPDAFKLFPDALPETVPPPIKERSFRAPFGIDQRLFTASLRPEVPVVIAITYVFSVFALNAYNRDRGFKPWAIAKTRLFQDAVVLHNVLLAIYSLLTFLAMSRALMQVWPGWHNGAGAAGLADAFCKLHGPRVLGDAVRYNQTLNIWETKNPLIHLTREGKPDPTDVGRLWNEGLAFWGWLFYVSKFYEVLDTLIILAKGKRSPTLQTYHHAGAMLSMWAGIRYMSPPIWMFVFINSGIHALMYTYYTLSAIGVKVPQSLKRTLTSMQIAQFIIGASFAAAHLFLKYDAPETTPYRVANIIQKIASAAGQASASATSVASAAASSPIVTTPLGNYLKKLLLRAAGEEGIAERVHNDRGDLINPKMEEKIQHFYEKTFETRYHADYVKTNCLDTSGQAFAVYLNLFYLFPLTWLFGRFFVKAYLSRGKPRSASDAAKQAYFSAKEAEKQTQASLERVEADVARRASFSKNTAKSEFKKDFKPVKRRLARPEQETISSSDADTSSWLQGQHAKSADGEIKEQRFETASSDRIDSRAQGADTPLRDSYDSGQDDQSSGWLKQQHQSSTRQFDSSSADDVPTESSWLSQTLSRRVDKIASLPPNASSSNGGETQYADRDHHEEPSQWLQQQASGTIENVQERVEQSADWVQHAMPATAATLSSQAQKASNWLEKILPTGSSEKTRDVADDAYSADVDDSLDEGKSASRSSDRPSKRVNFSPDDECAITDSPEPSTVVEPGLERSAIKSSASDTKTTQTTEKPNEHTSAAVDAQKQLKSSMKSQSSSASGNGNDKSEPAQLATKLQEAAGQVTDKLQETVNQGSEAITSDEVVEKAQDAAEEVKKSGVKVIRKAGQTWDEAKAEAKQKTAAAQKSLEKAANEAAPAIADVKETAQKSLEKAANDVAPAITNVEETAQKTVEKSANEAAPAIANAKETAQKTVSSLSQKGTSASRSSSPEKKAGSLIPKMTNKKAANDSVKSKSDDSVSVPDQATSANKDKPAATKMKGSTTEPASPSKSKAKSSSPTKDKSNAANPVEAAGGVKLSGGSEGQDRSTAPPLDQPAKTQDSILAKTKAIRPGSSGSDQSVSSGKGDKVDDTDAMGQSGIQVSKLLGIKGVSVEGAGQEGSESEGGQTATAALDGGKWHPPGVNGS